MNTTYTGGVESALAVILLSAEKMFAHLHFSNRWRLVLLLLVFLLQRVLVCLRVRTGDGHLFLADVHRILVGRSGLCLIIILKLLVIVSPGPFIKFLFAILSGPRFWVDLIGAVDVPLAGWHTLAELHVSLEAVVFADKHLFLHFPGYGLRVTEEGQRLPLRNLVVLLIRLFLRFWFRDFLLRMFLNALLLVWFVVRIELNFYLIIYRLQIQFPEW